MCFHITDSYRRWSDNNSWVNTTLGRTPIEGEDVVINSSWRMLLDVSPPPLGRVFVYGELKFEDERDYNFTAALVSCIYYLLIHKLSSSQTKQFYMLTIS